MSCWPCCVCMERDRDVVNIREHKWNALLTLVVPEVDWQSSWMVCTGCYTNLRKIEEFRELCLTSEIKRNAEKEATQESESKGEFKGEALDPASVDEAQQRISRLLCENIFF